MPDALQSVSQHDPPRREPAAQRARSPAAALEAAAAARDAGPRVAAQQARLATIASSPRALVQGRRFASASPSVHGAPAQRLLRTHATRNDEGEIVEGTGDAGFINEYARWLAQDTSALVDGEPVGASGLLRTLRADEVDGGQAAERLRDSVIGSGAWHDLNEDDLASLVACISEESGAEVDTASGETPEGFLGEFAGDYPEAMAAWVDTRLEGLAGADSVGAVPAGAVPFAWHSDMAFQVYDQTRTRYYAVDAQPYVPPFRALIATVGAGAVERFAYVRKYGGANKKDWGAEFTVAAPADLADRYAGKAVLHTHYPAADDAPHYAHTKPEDKKNAKGFGGTVVDVEQVRAVDDTSKAWNALL